MVNIKQCLAPAGRLVRPGLPMQPTYITIHNTANTKPSATAQSHADYLRTGGADKQVSYHYVVDENEIVQCIPLTEVAWHAGDGLNGTGNRKSIAIEICENGDLLKATKNAEELTAHLMRLHNIPLDNVVQHNKWSGKNCPNRIRAGQPYSWQVFISNVESYTSPAPTEPPFNEPTPLKIGFASSGDLKKFTTMLDFLLVQYTNKDGYITTDHMSKGDQSAVVKIGNETGVPVVKFETTPQVDIKELQALVIKLTKENEELVNTVSEQQAAIQVLSDKITRVRDALE